MRGKRVVARRFCSGSVAGDLPRSRCPLRLLLLSALAACTSGLSPGQQADAGSSRSAAALPVSRATARALRSCSDLGRGTDASLQANTPGRPVCGAPGSVVWLTHAPGAQIGNGVSAFADGSLVVTGSLFGSAIFGSKEPRELTLRSSTGADFDIFLAKYSAQGELVWAERIGGKQTDTGRRVAALADGGALLVGDFYGEATFGSRGESPLHAGSDRHTSFLARFDANGRVIWANRIDGGSEEILGLAAQADGSSLVSGGFQRTISFDSSAKPALMLTAAGGADVFVANYSAHGALLWARRAGGENDTESGHAAAFLPDGSAVVTGGILTPAEFGPGEQDKLAASTARSDEIFVARYDPHGKPLWIRSEGGEGADRGYGIAVLRDGALLVTGSRGVVAAEQRVPGLVSPGTPHMFLARYEANGMLAWIERRMIATGPDRGMDVAVSANSDAVVTGEFSGSGSFASETRQQITLTARGGRDMFIAKYEAGTKLAWATRAGPIDRVFDSGVSILSDGSVLVVGTVRRAATLGEGPHAVALEAGFFLAKLSP